MALVLGTNCGFVTTAPTVDPLGSSPPFIFDGVSEAMKYTSPIGAVKVTEIGWWSSQTSEETNYEVGIYSHDSGSNVPDELLGVARTNAKGTDAGWKVATGLNIAITAENIYWIAIQADATTTDTEIDANTSFGRISEMWTNGQSTLESPWVSGAAWTATIAIYAVYEEAAVGTSTFTKNVNLNFG